MEKIISLYCTVFHFAPLACGAWRTIVKQKTHVSAGSEVVDNNICLGGSV